MPRIRKTRTPADRIRERLSRLPPTVRSALRQSILDEYKWRLANRRIDFYVPLPHQEIFHRSESWNRWLIAANRAGKTEGGAVETLWTATGSHPYRAAKIPSDRPMRLAVISHAYQMQRRTVQPKIEKYLPKDRVIAVKMGAKDAIDAITINRSPEPSERNTLLSTIEFLTLEMGREKFQGASWDFVWFDEEPSHDIYIEVLRGLVDTGGLVIGTMTPIKGSASWVYDELFQNPDVHVTTAVMRDNSHLAEEDIRRYESQLSPEERTVRMEGRFVAVGGLVYPEYSSDVHELREAYVPRPEDIIVHGADTGRCFAAAWVAFRPDGDAVLFDECYTEDEPTPDNAHRMRLVEGRHPVKTRMRFLDATSQFDQDLARCGFPMMPARNDILVGINILKRLMKHDPSKPSGLGRGNPKFHVSPNCTRFKWELKRYQWDQYRPSGKLSGELSTKPLRKNNHMCDAVRYAMSHVPDEVERPEAAAEPVPRAITWDWIRKNRLGRGSPEADDFHPNVGLM